MTIKLSENIQNKSNITHENGSGSGDFLQTRASLTEKEALLVGCCSLFLAQKKYSIFPSETSTMAT
jgi:hypothetical protein